MRFTFETNNSGVHKKKEKKNLNTLLLLTNVKTLAPSPVLCCKINRR